jgi:hypothetical protein
VPAVSSAWLAAAVADVAEAVRRSAPGPLVLERVEVGDARLDAVVRVSDPSFLRTSTVEGLAAEVLHLMPGLSRHRCESGCAHGIRAELANTESPHLLEHVALELMALSGSPRDLRGETRWDFTADGLGVFHVHLDFDDDLVALGALSAALRIVNALLMREPRATVPDPMDEAMSLGGLRRS